jgi:hypothetical protein
MHPPPADQLGLQIAWLFALALPVATVSWTITHEEIFREPREYCQNRCRTADSILVRKCFYVFTCEWCLSHYVGLFFIALTGFSLLLDDWRGYVLSFFALPFVANIYMSAYQRLRVDIRAEKAQVELAEQAAAGDEPAQNGHDGVAGHSRKKRAVNRTAHR